MDFSIDNMNTAMAAFIGGTADLVVSYAFSVIGAIIILIAGFVIAGVLRNWTYRSLEHLKHGDETLAKFLATVVRYAILILVVVMVLSQFGVQTASIIAALGAAGLAIGLALQGTLQNIASGVMLLFLRPFKVGDYIDTGSVSGTVEDIGLFATEFKTLDGLFVLAPNSSVWGSPVTNFSLHDKRRFDLAVGIGYDDDIDLAIETLEELARADGRVLGDPEPYLYVNSLGDSAVEVVCRIWIGTSDWWKTSRDLTKQAKQAFDAKGISIPFPQRDVHYIPAKPVSGEA